MRSVDLSPHGITVTDVRRNLPPAELYAEALEHVRDTSMAVPPRPLPERVELRPADIVGRDVRVGDLLVRLRGALPPA